MPTSPNRCRSEDKVVPHPSPFCLCTHPQSHITDVNTAEASHWIWKSVPNDKGSISQSPVRRLRYEPTHTHSLPQAPGTPEPRADISGECGDAGQVQLSKHAVTKWIRPIRERKAFLSVGVLYYRLSPSSEAGGPVNSSRLHLACLCGSSPQTLRGQW